MTITKETAATALREAAFTDEDGRTTVHSFLGSFGADHDLDRALELVNRSDDRGWIQHPIGHNLGVLVDGKLYCYDAREVGP